jgi:hypothetical protein
MRRCGAWLLGLSLIAGLTGCNRTGSQSPAVTLSQAAEALGTVRGYHVHLETPAVATAPGRTSIDLDVRPSGSGSGTYHQTGTPLGPVTGQLLIDNHVIYGRGDQFAMFALGPDLGARIGSQWFAVAAPPQSTGLSLFDVVDYLTTPEAFNSCFATLHGTLTVAGSDTVNGQPVTVIADRGELATTAPLSIAVAATGAPYPIRVQQTGVAPGGTPDVCRLSRGIAVSYSDFGRVVPIDLPAQYVTIPA